VAVRIGCDNLVYAKMTTEDTVSTDPIYAAPVLAPGVMSVNINPNGSVETLFADDGPMDTASTLGKIDVEIKKSELNTTNKKDLLGHDTDTDGALVYGDSDIPPWVAIGFRTLKSNGKYRYVWLYKGKFTEPEDNNETKAESVKFQEDTIKGQFVKLNKAYTVNGRSVRPWKRDVNEDDAGVQAAVITGWFTQVRLPNNLTTAVTSIWVQCADADASISNGGTVQMFAGVLPLNASNPAVVWSVATLANGGAATISATGLLTATHAGTVTVTATAADGSTTTGTMVITIV